MQPVKTTSDQAIVSGAKALLLSCAQVNASDQIYIISNPSTSALGEILRREALIIGCSIEHEVIDEFKIHGQEPNKDIADKMLKANVVFCLTKMSMAHTQARLKANQNGVKYFSLPDYSADVMSSPALLADFVSLRPLSEKIASLLSNAESVRITTKNGTDLTMNVKGRRANPAPGFCYDQVLLASPPDAETNIAPLEFMTNGTAVVDGSIPCREIGLLESSVTLEIRDGRVKNISGAKAEVLNALFDRSGNPDCRVVGEFGIGLNRLAVLKGAMLEDEGALGTIHLGIGSNKTIGGQNNVPFHLDHVIRQATVQIDDILLMKDGVFVAEFESMLQG